MKKDTKKTFNYKVGALKRKLGEKSDQPGALIEAAKARNLKKKIAIRGLV